ncbi:hypothetical protein ABW19_dt0200242 [Dactylella cylindrospora]|nr:hypothetical protein ABW19_dt0200242 [Dactylella cylindrospora]
MAISTYSPPQSSANPTNSARDEDTMVSGQPIKRLKLSPPPPDPKIAVRNRRLIYLQNHEDYFTKTEHAFSLPNLYNQLVSRFMTGRDRREHVADPTSQSKFSEILARDLERGEDRMEKLRREREAHGDGDSGDDEEMEDENGDIVKKPKLKATTPTDLESQEPIDSEPLDAEILLQADADGEFSNIQNREEAWEIWREILSRRFLRGDDEDFDYESVDRPGGAGDPHHLIEVEIERDEWEEYFDEEEAEVYTERDGKKYLNGRVLEGETGVQDF